MATGKIVQVIGTVVDVEFPPDELPNLFDALELDNEGEKLTLEVQAHVGNNWVRCLALGATEGLARGTDVNDTGSKVVVPVGPETRMIPSPPTSMLLNFFSVFFSNPRSINEWSASEIFNKRSTVFSP